MSLAEHMQDMYEDMSYRRKEIQTNLDNGEGDSKLLLRQLSIINKVLGDEDETQDDLFEQWEKDLDEGRIPDLDAMPEGSE